MAHQSLLITTNTFYVSPHDWFNITFRLCLAAFFGAIIGLERQLKRKPAGLRTHMLVSIGAALFVLVPLQASMDTPNYDSLSRVIQGVATGIGFLGAGEILRQSPQEESASIEIHGLTSAAAIWISAALGIAAGCGLWQIGLVTTVLSFLVLNILKRLER